MVQVKQTFFPPKNFVEQFELLLIQRNPGNKTTLWLKPWFHSLWLMGFGLLLSWGGFWRCGEHFVFATVKVDQELLFLCRPLWFRVWFCFASPKEAAVVFLCPQASNENVPLVSGHFCVGAGNLTPRSQHSSEKPTRSVGGFDGTFWIKVWVQFMSSVYIRGDTVITGIEIWAGFFFFFVLEEVGENQLPPQKFSCLQILWNNIKISLPLN